MRADMQSSAAAVLEQGVHKPAASAQLQVQAFQLELAQLEAACRACALPMVLSITERSNFAACRSSWLRRRAQLTTLAPPVRAPLASDGAPILTNALKNNSFMWLNAAQHCS